MEDTGPGIAPEDLSKIFDAFEQSEAGRLAMEGTGLGLTISRRFIQLLGGSISVESEIAKGALFKFDIVIRAAETAANEPAVSVRRVVGLEPDQPRYRIMIADDNSTNRFLLIRLLESFGWDLNGVEDGQRAVELYKTWPAHLIFMDIRMPVMDGFEATRQIKSADEKGKTKIIAISATSSTNDRKAALAAGCDDFIAKPFYETDIYNVLEKHLKVSWVYETDMSPANGKETIDSTDNLQESISNLPFELRERLEDAISRADMAAIERLIVQTGDHAPRLAVKFQELAHDFEYEKILFLIQGAHKK